MRFALLLCLVFSTSAPASEANVSVSQAGADRHGILVHRVRSPYQPGETTIRVLLPQKIDPSRTYPVVYVLPVEAKDETRYGDGLIEVKKAGLADRHGAIFVEPTFAQLPWYADHPTDPAIRQESYLLKVVLPFVEKTYPARHDAGGRLLLGFSKSGWGAYSLLLRHPDLFARAAAWDAPLMMDKPGHYGSGPIFGTPDNFQKYRVSTLLEQNATSLAKGNRLVLLGYGNFREQVQSAHALMQSLHIPHTYRDGPKRPHTWSGGWLAEAAGFLFE